MSKINSDDDNELVPEVILFKFNENEILYFENSGTRGL